MHQEKNELVNVAQIEDYERTTGSRIKDKEDDGIGKRIKSIDNNLEIVRVRKLYFAQVD